MNQSKLIFYSLLGVAVGSVVAVSAYSINYFSVQTEETENRSLERKNKLAKSEPKIVIPADNCDLPNGYVKNSFYMDISSADVDKYKKLTEDLITSAGGTVLSTNEGRYPLVNDQSIIQKQVSFSMSLPQDKFKNFVVAMKKLGGSPNFLENESMNQETEYNVEINCKNALGIIKQLRQEEEIYLDQLQSDISFENKQEIIDTLTKLRQQAANNAMNIKIWTQNLDKSEINIIIREIVG